MWQLDTTYASDVFMVDDGSIMIPSHSSPFVKYSNDGSHSIVGDTSSHTLTIYRSLKKIKKISVKFTNAVISNNGSRIATVDENSGKIMVKHQERGGYYMLYYRHVYGYGYGKNIYIDNSGTVIVVSQSEDLYSDVFSGKVFTLRFDGQQWNESVIFQSVISDIQYLGYGMSVSSDSGFIAFNKHRLDITTTPHTVTRSVEIHKYITDGVYERVGPLITGGEKFGNILTISKNGRRIAIWDSYHIKVFGYDGSNWTQIGQSLPPGTNIFMYEDGGSVLIDNRLYKLN